MNAEIRKKHLALLREASKAFVDKQRKLLPRLGIQKLHHLICKLFAWLAKYYLIKPKESNTNYNEQV